MELLFISLVVMLLIGVPIGFCLIGSSFMYLAFSGSAPTMQVMYRMAAGIDSFPLLAVPFFIFAGALMNEGGITTRIFDFAKALVGWLRGGFAYVNISASVLFAGMTGAAVADAGGLGMIEIRAMREAGYDDDFTIGVTAASSTLGPIIPPSLAMVVYGVVSSTSIGKLFAAGLMPGIFTALVLSAMVFFIARKRNYGVDAIFAWNVLGYTFKRAFLSIMAPVIVIGGMFTGVYTPTEAAIAVSVYALILGTVVYRALTWKKLVRISLETAETTASILFIVSGAAIFSWILTANNVATDFAEWVVDFSSNPIVLLLLLNLILLIVGCFIDTLAAITILTPILLPIVMDMGMSPVHFGVMMVLNLNIGLLTPPVGVVLYILSKVATISFEAVVKSVLPFFIPLVVTLLMVTFVPQITMFLPNLIYGQ